jgi:protein-disulfide isomerase
MTDRLTVPDSKRDHIRGVASAPISMLEYGDYECPFCAEVQPIVAEIQERLLDDLCFAFRHFPLTTVHPHSEHAAEAAEAAGAQGSFWPMHEMLFQNQQALEDEDFVQYASLLGLDEVRLIREVEAGAHAERVRDDFKRGIRAGVNGTPTFFINGERYDGARGLEEMLAALTAGVG